MDIRTWKISTALLLTITVWFSGCSPDTKTGGDDRLGQASTMTVTAAVVVKMTLEEELLVTGSVEPWQRLTVSSELSGLRILSVPFEVGDYVNRGDAMVYLNDRNLRAQLSAAQARYASSVASLEKARNPNLVQQVASRKAMVEQAKAAVAQEEANLAQAKINQANSKRTASRYEQALQEGYVTALETDQRVTDRESQEAAIRAAEHRLSSAKANLEQVKQELNLSQAQGRSEDIAIAEGQTQENLASIEQLQAQLDQTVIRAPDSGLILNQMAFLGDVVTTGQELSIVARQGRLQLWGAIPQSEIPKIKVGQSVVFGLESVQIEGKVEEIDPDINPDTRQGRVRISLDLVAKELKVGAFLEGRVMLPPLELPVIPYEAVQGGTDKFVVFMADGEKVRSVPVELGARHDDLVEVTGGLSVGDSVIVSGAAFLNDGDSIRVVSK